METTTISPEKSIQHLVEVFGNTLHYEVIKSTAFSCNYDMEKATDMLLEIANDVQTKPTGGNNRPDFKISPTCAPVAQKKSRKQTEFDRVVDIVRGGIKTVIILRGLPGSGKSSLGRKIVDVGIGRHQNYSQFIFSADDYFVKNGLYRYEPLKIGDAHGMCQRSAFKAIEMGISPVIIDNTNVQMWEMKPYAIVACNFGYLLEILEPSTPWVFNDKELALRNTHGVPRNKIKDMLLRYEKNVTTQKLLSAYSLNFQRSKLPSYRSYPPIYKNVENDAHSNASLNGLVAGKLIPHMNAFHNQAEKASKKNDSWITIAEKVPETTNAAASLSLRNFGTGNSYETVQEKRDDRKHSDELHTSSAFVYISDDDDDVKEPFGFSLMEDSNKSTVPNGQEQTLNAWGLTEKALRCWNIVTPIEDTNVQQKLPVRFPSPKPEVKEAETNTCPEDFSSEGFACALNPQVKVVRTVCREINENNTNWSMAPRKKIMCDKSSSTVENVFIPDKKQHMELLTSVFPNIPRSYLKEMYEKCGGDINWTVELLSEDNKYALEDVVDMEVSDEFPDNDMIILEEVPAVEQPKPELDFDRKPKSKPAKIQNLELKKSVEKLIDIGKNFYSDHLLKIKKSRHPIYEEPSTSTAYKNQEFEIFPKQNEGTNGNFHSDGDECDLDYKSDSSDEMIELNLGETLVNDLESKLHEPNFTYPKGFQPVVQLPLGMAKQLFALYIESVFQQLDAQKEVLETMIKEDEAFAKKLQEQEHEQAQEHQTEAPKEQTLTEIMEDQYATSLYQKEVDQWQMLTPDDLAAKLTKQKLIQTFPGIDPIVLIEIWQAHGNNYNETVESILASNPDVVRSTNGSITELPIPQDVVDEMKECEPQGEPKNVMKLDFMKSANEYRDEASVYREKRTELYRKAQEYYQKGMREVAQYYSELAQKQTEYFDRANNMAANAFLNEHSQRIKDFGTLDLHFLHVREAVSALDMFIDNNVHLLKGKTASQNLFVITGRGNNSIGRIPRIKPAVKRRLKSRNIKYKELNPGLLEIWVNNTTSVTSDLHE